MTNDVDVTKPALEYFAACQAEQNLDDALLKAFGADPEETDTWPCGDMGYDWYDCSFELWGTKNEFTPTDAQLAAAWDLGFARGWICYRDGTEVYVSPHHRGERKPSRHDQNANGKRCERQHFRHLAQLQAKS